MDSYIGKLLDNRYELLEVIGTGGMARVYKARCHRLNRLVAVKILREDLAQDAELRRRFHDESQAVAMLSHPNIVAVYDVSRSSELEYIVMELIDGITLKQYMQKKGDKLNWREALHFITQITKALGHAHSRGIIHRDIKPHNIMVLRDGSVKVADFGIARVASGGHSTLTQEALGSVHYISPEQARGSHIDARSDLYSAGVVLYEMITGRLPFEGDTPVSVAIQHINSIPLSPRELDPTIPEALEAITMKAMAPNPDDRYPNADAMLADLEEFRKNPNINFDYSVHDLPEVGEPDEEEKTQIRTVTVPRSRRGEPAQGIHSGERPAARRRYQEDSPERDSRQHREERGSPWPVVAAVLVILAFLAGVGVFLYSVFFSDIFSPPEQLLVPKVVDQVYDEIKDDQSILQDTFTIVVGETVESDRPAGTILEQTPLAGSDAKQVGTQITVRISAGPPETIDIPPLTGTEYRTAIAQLRELGLKVATPVRENSADIPKDQVIRTEPAEGTPMLPGDEVTLVVSDGEAVETVPVPALIGQNLDFAQKNLALYNLTLVTEEVFSDTYKAGIVVDQYPIASTEVPVGSEVRVLLSKGPDPDAQENPTQELKTKEVSMNLPAIGTIVTVRVMMEGEEVYTDSIDTAMRNSVDFTVTGSGVKVLELYVDGRLEGTQTVDFDA